MILAFSAAPAAVSPVLAQSQQFVLLQHGHQFGDGIAPYAVAAQGGGVAHFFEEIPRCLNGVIDDFVFVAVL